MKKRLLSALAGLCLVYLLFLEVISLIYIVVASSLNYNSPFLWLYPLFCVFVYCACVALYKILYVDEPVSLNGFLDALALQIKKFPKANTTSRWQSPILAAKIKEIDAAIKDIPYNLPTYNLPTCDEIKALRGIHVNPKKK